MNNKEKIELVLEKIKKALTKAKESSYSAEMKLNDLEESLVWIIEDEFEQIMYKNSFLACLPDIVFENYTMEEYESNIEWQQEQLSNEGEDTDNISLSGIYKYKYDTSKTLDILLNFDFESYFILK